MLYVRIKTNAGFNAARLKRISNSVNVELGKSLKKMQGPIKLAAQIETSGQFPQSDFDAQPGRNPHANHPYGWGPRNARGPRGSVPYSDPGVINQQSGELKGGWDTAVTLNGLTGVLVLFNQTEHSHFIAASNELASVGTQGHMVYRPVLENIHKLADPLFNAEMLLAWRRALQTP